MTVCAVGRKYFRVKIRNFYEVEFHICDWTQKTDYSADYRLYQTEQEWRDEDEVRGICDMLWHCFQYGNNMRGISLGDLRTIAGIVGKYQAKVEG